MSFSRGPVPMLLAASLAFLVTLSASALAQEIEAAESLRKKVHDSMQRLHSRLDARESAELSLLAQELAAGDLDQGRVREAFAALGPAIHFQARCLETGLGDAEPARVLLVSLYESFGAALTHLGEFELAVAAFSFGVEEASKLRDGSTARFPPANPARNAESQRTFLKIRMAAAYRAAGRPQDAWAVLKSLQNNGLVESLGREGLGFFHSEFGNALEDLGRFAEALENYSLARSIWQETGDRKRELFELKTMGDALRKMGKPQEALARYEEASAMEAAVSCNPLESHELETGLAIALSDLGRRDEALLRLEKAREKLQEFHAGLAGSERAALRTRSFASVCAAMGAWARVRFESEGQAAALPTLVDIDRWRGRGVTQTDSAGQSPDPPALDRERSRSSLRRELQMHSGDPSQRAALRQSLSRIDLRLMTAGMLRPPGPATPQEEDWSANRPPDGVVLLEYFLGPEDAFLWVLTRDGCRWVSLAKGSKEVASLSKSASSFANAVGHRGEDIAGPLAAEDLAARILPDDLLAELSKARALWIVPDGEMHRVPWAAIPWKGDAPAIAVFPSAAFALRMGERAPAKPGFVDVFASPAAQAEGFDPLRFSESEGRAIAETFPGSRLRLGGEASEDALRQVSGSPGPLLHISSHGIFSRALPEGSALLLAPGEKEDGWLWASEIRQLDFSGRLVVLSSCHSGEGEWIPGEGVSGLSQAFLAAGARAVVGTLWAVDQEPTTQLMKEFYRRLAQGESAGEALARAPEALRAGSYSGEAHWAGLRLYGDSDWRLPQAPQASPGKGQEGSVVGSYGFWLLVAASALFLFLAIRGRGR